MGLKVKCTILLFFLALVFTPSKAISNWVGPSEIIRGTWGKEANQFGFRSGESNDYYPTSLVVLPDGRIVIDDSVNNRLLIYQNNGTYIKSIKPKPFVDIVLGFNDNILVFDWDSQNKASRIGFYEVIQEKWLWKDVSTKFSNVVPDIMMSDNTFIIWDGKAGYKYSTTGQLIKTYSSKPAEFGVIRSSKRQPEGGYQMRVEYPDLTFNVTASSKVEIEDFKRDLSSHLYSVAYAGQNDNQNYRVYKYSTCGKTLGFVDLPADDIVQPEFVQKFPRQPSPKATVNGEYGKPIIAANGDVYTWKRSDTAYSILKWTWVDDPNVPTGPDAPSGLAVTPSINGLYLTWKVSPNDPGCVTKYEIARSTTSGGVFSTIDTVEKGVLKYNDTTAETGPTYYYKVRAMAGSDPSLYTAEVYGKR